MTCMNPRGHGAFRAFAHPTGSAFVIVVAATIAAQVAALAQSLDVKRYNPSEWTKGRFSEVVTVTGAGKTIYLAGVGAEDENAPAGASAPIRHLGNPYEQFSSPEGIATNILADRLKDRPRPSSQRRYPLVCLRFSPPAEKKPPGARATGLPSPPP